MYRFGPSNWKPVPVSGFRRSSKGETVLVSGLDRWSNERTATISVLNRSSKGKPVPVSLLKRFIEGAAASDPWTQDTFRKAEGRLPRAQHDLRKEEAVGHEPETILERGGSPSRARGDLKQQTSAALQLRRRRKREAERFFRRRFRSCRHGECRTSRAASRNAADRARQRT